MSATTEGRVIKYRASDQKKMASRAKTPSANPAARTDVSIWYPSQLTVSVPGVSASHATPRAAGNDRDNEDGELEHYTFTFSPLHLNRFQAV